MLRFVAFSRSSLRPLARAGLAAGLVAFAFPAFAQSCQDDFQRLSGRRDAQMKELNAMTAGGKKKLDPEAACPKLRNLAAIERELLGYMTTNKDWCQIPDEALDSVKKGSARTAQVAAQACNVAVQVRKAKEAAARGEQQGGPAPQRLPAGPL